MNFLKIMCKQHHRLSLAALIPIVLAFSSARAVDPAPLIPNALLVGATATQSDAEDSLYLAISHLKNPLSAEFFAGVPFLWNVKDPEGNMFPGNGTILKSKDRISFSQFDNITISLQKKASYKNGDTLDIYHSIKLMTFKDRLVNLVRRVGVAVVTDDKCRIMQARVLKAWDAIGEGDRIAARTPFKSITIDSLVTGDRELDAFVFSRVEKTEVPYLYQSFIVDKGTDEGVAVGDVFLVYSEDKKKVSLQNPEVMAFAAHVDRQASTLVILKMYRTSLEPADRAVRVRRSLME